MVILAMTTSDGSSTWTTVVAPNLIRNVMSMSSRKRPRDNTCETNPPTGGRGVVSTAGGPDARDASYASGEDVEDVDDVGARSLQAAIAAETRRGTVSNRSARMGCTSGSEFRGEPCPPAFGSNAGIRPRRAGAGCREKPKTGSNRLTALLPPRGGAAYDLPRRPPERLAGRRVLELSGHMPPHDPGTMQPQDHSPPPPIPAGAPAGELRDLFSTVYEQLRRIAPRHLDGALTGPTLGTTGLVHEAYLELERLERVRWFGRAYVLAAASQAMRRILVDYAVARRAQKRGGGVVAEPLDDAVAMATARSDELLALDEALDRLAAVDARCARVVECRFYGGMSIEETAEALETSPA